MRVLVACEESQQVTKAFRAAGHEAYSCDVQPCSGGHPEWHIQQDVFTAINGFGKCDLLIAHPPCTFLTVANTYITRGCSKYTKEQAVTMQKEAIDFFLAFTQIDIEKVCIENPIGIMSRHYRKPDQIIQPWWYGDPESKATCLWLKGLPELKPVRYECDWLFYRCHCGNIFEYEYSKYGCCAGNGERAAKPFWNNQTRSGQNKLPPSKDRAKLRSKTYPGIARAMAEQWGNL